ncbi:galaxin-2-like isoform X2 [Gadus macrocephalus]|uniref:galaxin-2-like isoform X2 n=1 Tax=Gadus macrocephalus TaxID=80720 RepID=UPI0028CB4ADE|nr:galaxin-2-like isoform X2 [Gadus macrocephalus]
MLSLAILIWHMGSTPVVIANNMIPEPGTLYKCCGQEAYNEDRQLCCGRLRSVKILMKEHKDSICCGDVQYNPETQRCCGDHPEINDISISCETDYKQVLTQEPTANNMIPEPGTLYKCCGQEAYNEDRQLCCGSLRSVKILMKEHKDSICCGDVQYNPETQRCCGDHPEINDISISCETDYKQVLTQEPTANNRMSGPGTLSKCCGQAAYNVYRQLCCGRPPSEKILMKEHKDSVCCGDVQYNPVTQGCCGNPPEINDLSVPYETDSDQGLTQEPTVNNMIPTPGTLSKCCGQAAYNVDQQLCCGRLPSGKILMKEHKGSLCCGDVQYNPETQGCCGNPPEIKDLSV